MFMRGKSIELHALEESAEEAKLWTKAVNAGLTTKHLFTGSYPMRSIDVLSKWKKEREAGDVNFGIWIPEPKVATTSLGDATVVPGRRFIGTIGLHSHREIYRSWEMRVLIFDPNAIGKGYGTEAVTLITDYAFTRLNAHRTWLGVSAANVGAVKCYENVGYKLEGRLRDEIFTYGRYYDVLRMGILEIEWSSIKR